MREKRHRRQRQKGRDKRERQRDRELEAVERRAGKGRARRAGEGGEARGKQSSDMSNKGRAPTRRGQAAMRIRQGARHPACFAAVMGTGIRWQRLVLPQPPGRGLGGAQAERGSVCSQEGRAGVRAHCPGWPGPRTGQQVATRVVRQHGTLM